MNPEEYFSGKTVRIITGASGGSYDAFSRFVAETAGDYFPRGTTFDVENVTGAGQYNGLSATLDSAPDGLTVGIVHTRWIRRQAVVGDIPDFDLDEVHILGSPAFTVAEDAYCVDRRVATSWQEVLDLGRPLRIGAYEPGTEPAVEFMAANGGPFQMVYGYPGALEAMEAFGRGEVDLIAHCDPAIVRALFPRWIGQGRLVPLFYVKTPYDRADLARLGHTGPLPSILELPGLGLDEHQRVRLEALQANLLLTDVTHVFILPPGVPDVLREYWQERFDSIMRDRQLITSIHRAGYVDWYGHGSPDAIRALILRVQALDQDAKSFLYDVSGLSALDSLVQ